MAAWLDRPGIGFAPPEQPGIEVSVTGLPDGTHYRVERIDSVSRALDPIRTKTSVTEGTLPFGVPRTNELVLYLLLDPRSPSDS